MEYIFQGKETWWFRIGGHCQPKHGSVGKWHWRFPKEHDSRWASIIWSKYGCTLNGWDSGQNLPSSNYSPWKGITLPSPSFCFLLNSLSEMDKILDFGRILDPDAFLPRIGFLAYWIVQVKNHSPISLLVSSTLDWNLHLEEILERWRVRGTNFLIGALKTSLRPDIPYRRIWSLGSDGIFSGSSFF